MAPIFQGGILARGFVAVALIFRKIKNFVTGKGNKPDSGQ